MKRRSVLSVFLMTAIVLASCTGSNDEAGDTSAPEDSTPTTATTVSESPTTTVSSTGPEGTLRIARASFQTENFLPWTGALARNSYLSVMYDFLLHADSATKEPRPGLAESWEASDDLTEYTFHLRAGVPWHGGEGTVTADDVKYTLEQVMREDSVSVNASYFRGIIESVTAVDELTVQIVLQEPDTTLLAALTSLGSNWIVPKEYTERVGEEAYEQNPIGSGPYAFEGMSSGESITYEAVADHWRVVPAFQTLIYRLVAEESTRLALLQTGDVDIVPITPQSVGQLEDEPSLEVFSFPGAYGTGWWFGGMLQENDSRYVEGVNNSDPWTDRRVREAMSMAINRQELVDTIYEGLASPLNILYFTPGHEDLPPVEYDPDRARELLAEAGYADGFDFELPTFTLNPGAELPVLIEALAGYWEAIGLRPQLAAADYQAAIRPLVQEARTNGMIVVTRLPDQFDWESFLALSIPAESPLPAVSDARYAEMFDALVGETDPEQRSALFEEITQYQDSEFIYPGIALVDSSFGARAEIVGSWPAPGSGFDVNHEYISKPNESLPFQLFEP